MLEFRSKSPQWVNIMTLRTDQLDALEAIHLKPSQPAPFRVNGKSVSLVYRLPKAKDHVDDHYLQPKFGELKGLKSAMLNITIDQDESEQLSCNLILTRVSGPRFGDNTPVLLVRSNGEYLLPNEEVRVQFWGQIRHKAKNDDEVQTSSKRPMAKRRLSRDVLTHNKIARVSRAAIARTNPKNQTPNQDGSNPNEAEAKLDASGQSVPLASEDERRTPVSDQNTVSDHEADLMRMRGPRGNTTSSTQHVFGNQNSAKYQEMLQQVTRNAATAVSVKYSQPFLCSFT